MMKIYTKGHTAKKWRKLALLGLLSMATGAAHAQALNYNVNNASNVAGTYTDLGSSGTVITTANTDDANSAATPIGFTFRFNGLNFTTFVLNTNGAVRLGSVAPSATDLFITQIAGSTATDPVTSTNPADVNLLMPFNIDLIAGTAAGGAEYRVATTGTSPNRVCTVQWKNVSDKPGSGSDAGSATQFASFDFQLKLYETSNRVEFVYGSVVAGGPATFRFPNVGIKGSGSASGQTVLASKAQSGAAWSTAEFITGTYTTFTHNFRSTVPPDLGRTYRFNQIPPFTNDVAVRTIFTLGQLTQSFNSPHVVQAQVSNNGIAALTNVPVTLTVSGANTFTNTRTVTSLPVGATATVTFTAYPLTNLGTNTVTVTVPDDEQNSNNSVAVTQNVSPSRLSYIDPAAPLFATGVGVGTPNGILAAKYSVVQPAAISAISPTFAASPGNTNTYRVLVLDATGAGGTPNNILYTSPEQTRTPAAGTVTISVPNVPVSGSFYLGIQETATSDSNPALAYQVEDPLRANTFYFQSPGGAWTPINNTTLRTRLALEATLTTPPTCQAPTALTVTNITTTSAVVNFNTPANGTAYSVIYGPKGFNPASGGTTVAATASTLTLTGLVNFTEYDVYVRANCGATDQSTLTGPVSFRTICQPSVIAAFPYAENFDGVAASGNVTPCGITVLNANNDSKSWRVASSFVNASTGATVQVANSAPNALIYEFNNATGADDWFFTPPLNLTVGNRYQLTFKYRTFNPNFAEKMEVKFGRTDTPAGQTTTIWNNANIRAADGYVTTGAGTVPAVMAITPTTSGTYYIGFHAYSDRDQFVLAVDDLGITSSVVLGSSSALQQAITLYPNPTAGNLTVDVRGANAKNGLQVEVTNMLGQRVHTSTVRDNAVKVIDLSNLANGMYSVKVRNGNEFMVRNISVQK